jgi:Zn-dependent protease with chaperone function
MMAAEEIVSPQPSISDLEPDAQDAPAVGADAPVEYVNHATLPVNDLASSYQPRRVWAAGVSIGWNLLLAGLFVGSGAARHLLEAISWAGGGPGALSWVAPVYFAFLFGGYALANLPLELWFGYLGERQFALAKDGIRAWARDWMIGNLQHGVMIIIGACLILAAQILSPQLWIVWIAGALLVLFVGTTYFAADLIPPGLFNFERADDSTVGRLAALLPATHRLPQVVVYTHSTLREYAGGIVGLGGRRRYLISRSTLASASDGLLRFVLLHDLGHRRYHHNLLAALAGWAWVVIGLAASHLCIPRLAFASPLYVPFLALALSAWMTISQPGLAYLGRRLEYQADRFYLRSGGTLEEMRAALTELAQRNLARTELLRRRQTIFHPLPSVTNRLYRARQFVEGVELFARTRPASGPAKREE